jgi:hypothetical protein
MKAIIIVGTISLIVAVTLALNPLAASRQKALTLVQNLTTAQKLSLLHGMNPHIYVGQTIGYPALGIPPLHLQDGPQVHSYFFSLSLSIFICIKPTASP